MLKKKERKSRKRKKEKKGGGWKPLRTSSVTHRVYSIQTLCNVVQCIHVSECV